MRGDSEFYGVVNVWASVFTSLTYCYALQRLTGPGPVRLASVLPIVVLFLLLPLRLSSVHIGGSTAFFIAWLANFKLLMFALGKGPLTKSDSFLNFIAIASLPIKIRQNPHPGKADHEKPQNCSRRSVLNFRIKLMLLGVLLLLHNYSDRLPWLLIWFLYCFHIYLCLEIILAVVAMVVRAALGIELEPQFNEPYMSTSLQDFWGRRWNLMVTSILRPTVYEPVLSLCSRVVSRKYAPLPAVLGTFVVSAIMHELMFYYLGRVRPTGEITGFFLLHGICLMVEIGVKKRLKLKRGLPIPLSGLLTVGFMMITAFWLFLPPLLRCRADVRAFEEYAAWGQFVKDAMKLNLYSFKFV
ncbi:hypothetical protein SAY86_012707 [Trapa natans]|uniref:Wax synthase domain-containing protein n=1 Tax=Trapa natans TaxID=22666 RepID=A0AAN7LSK4_TRANT|nr:hypothetical protein SAY86_012707 [Trapa natans]